MAASTPTATLATSLSTNSARYGLGVCVPRLWQERLLPPLQRDVSPPTAARETYQRLGSSFGIEELFAQFQTLQAKVSALESRDELRELEVSVLQQKIEQLFNSTTKAMGQKEKHHHHHDGIDGDGEFFNEWFLFSFFILFFVCCTVLFLNSFCRNERTLNILRCSFLQNLANRSPCGVMLPARSS
ncbi:hypothetical protein QOT17_018337 [Balamuthia mandrillaris]